MKNSQLFLLLILLTTVLSNSFGQNKTKSKFIGHYRGGMSIHNKSDTISESLFLTLDSFLLLPILHLDSDYHFPIIKGQWTLNANNNEVSFQFDNGAIIPGRIDAKPNTIGLYFGDTWFYLDR
jgi:hypothetical protein